MPQSTNARHPHAKGFSAPSEGLLVTHLLIVADPDRSREFYRSVLGAEVGNTWMREHVMPHLAGPPDRQIGKVVATSDN